MSGPNLHSYREIAAGTTGAFMAPADVAVLLGEIDRLREEWAQEGIGWLRDKDIDRLMGVEAENERLRAAVNMARSRLMAIRNGEAFQPHLHAAAGLDEINDFLAST